MATMVKEKRREKKKAKVKHEPKSIEQEQPSISKVLDIKNVECDTKISMNVEIPKEDVTQLHAQCVEHIQVTAPKETTASIVGEVPCKSVTTVNIPEGSKTDISQIESETKQNFIENNNFVRLKEKSEKTDIFKQSTYQDLTSKLERIAIPKLDSLNAENIEKLLETASYVKIEESKSEIMEADSMISTEMMAPTAPIFEEDVTLRICVQESEVTTVITPKIQCMPLEEAIRVFGGREMAEVKAMSEREEAIVEAGPVSGPEHPLVDLLTTFRSSLIAVERERTQLARGFAEEEKFRNTLWKIEKRNISVSEDCPCGATVDLKATYEHAELLKERLPAAKLKLEALLRDVQETYCHHQHAALLAHCQIEQLISETVKSSKNEIREALTLILQALRLSDSAPPALSTALQRWATALSAALLDGRDLRQLLFLLHHLFRQTRSVVWAARVVRMAGLRAGDRAAAAQLLALLDLMLGKPQLETATECQEDADAEWEEVGERGNASGGVSEGALRERDLLAALRGLPLRQLVATLVLHTRANIREARENEWSDSRGGRDVLVSCCGVRALLAAAARGVTSHAHYSRLRAYLRELCAHALHALAGLYLHTRDSYSKDLEGKILAELEASFAAGVCILGPEQIDEVPTTLLRDDSAREYCIALIVGLHDKTPKLVESIPVELPVLPCAVRVRVVAAAARDRHYDSELAAMVLQFLFQTGIKRKAVPCKGECEATARELLPMLLTVHPYLYSTALYLLADLHQMEPCDASSVEPLYVSGWRAGGGEVTAVLDDWGNRCAALLPHLLLRLDCTPHTGLSLEAQLAIGSWLCQWVRESPPPEWAWSVLQRLRAHAAWWGQPRDASPPQPDPTDVFSTAYAILSSSWGHCIPVICREGVTGLCAVARARAATAVHCLAPLMLVMAHSPDSISLTPGFVELFNILLKSGPTVVQRALGLGPPSGSEMVLRLVLEQIEGQHAGVSRSAVVCGWVQALWAARAWTALEAALLASRDWGLFDTHAATTLQDSKSSELVSTLVREAGTAPLLCECVLRAAHARDMSGGVAARLLAVLHLQRVAGDRIHVDNAQKQIGVTTSAEELVIYRAATALQWAPLSHPAHLMLWRLFFHLYLQRPPNTNQEATPPVGPLFFSGLIKSRVLAQIRKKLQDTITYHEKELETFKQNKQEQKSEQSSKVVNKTPPPDNNVVPQLGIRDLTGESSDSDNDSEESDREKEIDVAVSKENDGLMLKYHEAARNMCKEFLRWLDEADNTRAMPHHADIARFIPEKALDEAWSRALSRRRPPPASPPPPATPPPSPTPATVLSPFQATVQRLLQIKDCSTNRLEINLKSPIEDVESCDARSLLTVVDKYFTDIENLAQEWSTEVARIASLDSALWELVRELRVRRPLQPVHKQCPHRCKPVAIHIPHHEWCISPGSERGIKDNRSAARALVRRLARPRPHAARSVAALITIARRIRSVECAVRVSERAWRCARAGDGCALALTALTTLVEYLAERWLCESGACVQLVARWSNGSAAQRALCGALIQPRRTRPENWPPLYAALAAAPLPPHAAFSYLSKFELSRWVETANSAQRREILEVLHSAALRWGPDPHTDLHVLLELIGIHTASILSAQELCAYVVRCARASAACALPAAHWPHVVRAVARHAREVPFDQLGHVLRELGVVWWEARTGLKGSKHSAHFAAYSAHTAALLHALQRAFVAAAVALSYAPERVAVYAWSGLQESWSPWLAPHPAPPLLPSTAEQEAYTPMLKYFVDNVHQIMLDCPGTEEYLLQQIFEWTVVTYLSVSGASQECRVQASALLAAFAALPWDEHQWLAANTTHHALMVCAGGDRELQSWAAGTWRRATAAAWLRAAPASSTAASTAVPAQLLAHLLQLFTAMPHEAQTLDEACQLPWWWLPEAALEQGMERFYAQHHDPGRAYHDLPQFRVILHASELRVSPLHPAASVTSRRKRGCGVSRWVRAAAAPALAAHHAAHAQALLNVLTDLAPHIEDVDGDLEELLGRAVVIMCEEPAAAAALPVWQRWVSSAPARMVSACLSAAGVLTAVDYFADLGDVAARVYLTHQEWSGWQWSERWSSRGADAPRLATRARLHAAYAALRGSRQEAANMAATLRALVHATLNFIEDEAIIAVWICLACRVARESACEPAAGGERAERVAAARALLARWADARRALLSLVSMHAPTDLPTARHKLLCRLAQCITSNSESTIQGYEAACTSVLGSNTDVLSWGKTPHPRKLPRLAIRLYPNCENYFKDEFNLTPED